MARSNSGKKRYNFLIDHKVYGDFSAVCEELGLVRSKRLEIYMREFVEEHKEHIKKTKKGEGH